MKPPLLEMQDLSVELSSDDKVVDIVSDLTLTLNRGERLGIVGESGGGKSITALAAMCLLPDQMRLRGSLRFDGQDLVSMQDSALCKLRGRRMAMIFQEPMTALNPVKSIGAQIAEGRRLHFGESRVEAEQKARILLDRVGLPTPRFELGLYPHQLSGGQRQRVMIAMAISCEPDLLIADEPTTALDVTIQAQILALMDELIDESGAALLLITHDLGVISQMTDQIAVMYAGRIVETGLTETVFEHMAHPYTRALFAASPHNLVFTPQTSGRRQRLSAISGMVPSPQSRPPFCNFAERCAFVQADCRQSIPSLAIPSFEKLESNTDMTHRAACFHPREGKVLL